MRVDRVLYRRALKLCKTESATVVYFEIEYDKKDINKMNPIINRLVGSFGGNGNRL